MFTGIVEEIGLVRHVEDVALAPREPPHALRDDVQPDHAVARTGEGHRERQTDVAQADDSDRQGPIGHPLEEALRTSLVDLDGTFSCIVATRDAIGYAKDKLAAKPMVKYEDDHLVAIASEEVALNRLFPGQVLKTTEPPPLTYGLWSRH